MTVKAKPVKLCYKLRAVATYLLLAIFMLTIFSAGVGPVFAQDTMPRRAVISAMEGSVLVQAAGQATAIPARRNMEIKSGDRIITGRDGNCTIRYDDGSTTRIGPNSRLDIANLTRKGTGGPDTTILNAQRGTLWNNAKDVVKRNSRFEVNTPSAIAGVRGTFWVSTILPNGDTMFVVLGGGLYVSPATGDLDPEEPGEEDWEQPVTPPADLAEGVVVEGGQQLGVTSGEELPEDAEPLDYDDLDDLTLLYVAEDNPDIFENVIDSAVAQGATQFLERINQLIKENEDMQQTLGDKLEQIQKTVEQTTSTPPPSSPPDDDGDDPAPLTYTLTVTASPSGEGTVTGGGSYAAGEVRTITAIPETGYAFLNWSATAGTLADDHAAQTTFTMPAQNVTVTAYFTEAAETYTLTVEAETIGEGQEPGGTVTESGSYAAGTEVTLIAHPNEGDDYNFFGWKVSEEDFADNLADEFAMETTFTMPAEDVTVRAIFSTDPVFNYTQEIGYDTIQSAVDVGDAAFGDTILISPEIYEEVITVRVNGLTIRSVSDLGNPIIAGYVVVGSPMELNGGEGDPENSVNSIHIEVLTFTKGIVFPNEISEGEITIRGNIFNMESGEGCAIFFAGAIADDSTVIINDNRIYDYCTGIEIGDMIGDENNSPVLEISGNKIKNSFEGISVGYIYSGSLAISHNTFTENEYGLRFWGVNDFINDNWEPTVLKIEDNFFESNKYGLYFDSIDLYSEESYIRITGNNFINNGNVIEDECEDGAAIYFCYVDVDDEADTDIIVVNDNKFSDNYCGIVNNSYYHYPVNAAYNWWGHASGPYHECLNPNGEGNKIIDYDYYHNVIFTPWWVDEEGSLWNPVGGFSTGAVSDISLFVYEYYDYGSEEPTPVPYVAYHDIQYDIDTQDTTRAITVSKYVYDDEHVVGSFFPAGEVSDISLFVCEYWDDDDEPTPVPYVAYHDIQYDIDTQDTTRAITVSKYVYEGGSFKWKPVGSFFPAGEVSDISLYVNNYYDGEISHYVAYIEDGKVFVKVLTEGGDSGAPVWVTLDDEPDDGIEKPVSNDEAATNVCIDSFYRVRVIYNDAFAGIKVMDCDDEAGWVEVEDLSIETVDDIVAMTATFHPAFFVAYEDEEDEGEIRAKWYVLKEEWIENEYIQIFEESDLGTVSEVTADHVSLAAYIDEFGCKCDMPPNLMVHLYVAYINNGEVTVKKLRGVSGGRSC